ncbi:MAG TPA: hypothetical protein VGR88_06900, partial [Ktedonobacterales bacterium]|nr:hypothetical protein [Ktedonobacterales bacterium]
MMTPARKQYLDIKEQHQGAILLYQVGDFYETFDEDARIAARELRIVLTSRAYGPEERVPLAGVPVHALETYAAKLVAAGHKVAICEQVSPPGRGLVRREVTRILTPGTLTDPGLVPPLRDNYLAAVVVARDGKGEVNGAGFAYVEVSAGAFACTEWTGDDARDALEAELYRLAPAEILLPEVASDHDEPTTEETAWLDGLNITRCPAHSFDLLDARERLLRHFGTRSLAAFGCAERPLATIAAAAIVAYLARMNPNALRLLTDLATYDTCGFVEMDARTWRALEVAEPPHGTREGLGRPSKGQPLATLLGVLDETRTPMGTRLLRRTLRQPLRDRATLEERLDAVDALYADAGPRQRVRRLLDGLPDLERLIARVVHGSATARELYSLRAGLLVAHDMRRALRHLTATGLVGVRDALNPCKDVCA